LNILGIYRDRKFPSKNGIAEGRNKEPEVPKGLRKKIATV